MKEQLIVAAICILLASCGNQKQAQDRAIPTQEALIKKGAYLVGIMGCGDCHSPKIFTQFGPEPDPEKLFSGHPSELSLAPIDKNSLSDWVLFGMHNTTAIGPWGASFAANITSDKTGIGNWNLNQFKKAMKKGKYKGIETGRSLLPPMPWINYTHLIDEDIEAIFAFLKSTKPVRNIVPSSIPPSDLTTIN